MIVQKAISVRNPQGIVLGREILLNVGRCRLRVVPNECYRALLE